MALAFIRYTGTTDQTASFEADTGSNTCYQYVIGSGRQTINGLETVQDPTHASAIIRRSDPATGFSSLFSFDVPYRLFSNKDRFIQLRSYKDPSKKGMALSAVVEIFPDILSLPEELPQMSSLSALSNAYSLTEPSKTRGMSVSDVTCRSVGFTFRESRLSRPMFLQTLLDVARLLAPQVVSGISNLATQGHPNAQTNEEIVRIINSVIGLLGNGGTAAAPAPAPAVAAPAPAPVSAAAPAPAPAAVAAHSIHGLRWSGQQSLYSRQQTPALAALIPMLMQNLPAVASALGPLLQNLPQMIGPIMERAPQLLQTVEDSPIRLLNAIGEFASHNRELNIQNKQADQQHIERILADINRNLLLQQLLRANPGGSLPALPAAPTDGTVATATSVWTGGNGRSGQGRATQVAISLQKNTPLTVNGKPKYVYSNRGGIRLQVQVRVNDGVVVPRAVATLVVRDSVNRKVYLEKKIRLEQLSGNAIKELELLPQEVQQLPQQADLLVSASLRYQTDKKVAGSSNTDVHFICISGPYCCKHLGNKVGDDIPLSDRNKYRVFWNKIWEGGARDKKRWEIGVDAKYYISYRHNKDSNGRIETRIKKGDEDTEHKMIIRGQLKSGLEIVPQALNNLLAQISNYPELRPEQLKALQTDELASSFNSEAVTRLEMRGNNEETGSIWAFPEVAIHQVVLLRLADPDANGQVAQATEEEVFFPKPTYIHFTGEKTK